MFWIWLSLGVLLLRRILGACLLPQFVRSSVCSARDVSIDDFSHSVLKRKQQELDAINFFCGAIQDRLMHLMLERDDALTAVQTYSENVDVKLPLLTETFTKTKQEQLNNDYFYEILQDKVNNLLQDRHIQKDRYNSIIQDMTAICDVFGDIVPLKKIDDGQTNSEFIDTGFSFSGNKTNPSRNDQLALALLKILHDGIIYETKHSTTTFCG